MNRMLLIIIVVSSSWQCAVSDTEMVIDMKVDLDVRSASGDIIAVVSITNSSDDVYRFAKQEVGILGYSMKDVFEVIEGDSGRRLHQGGRVFSWDGPVETCELGKGETYTVMFNLTKLYDLSDTKSYKVRYSLDNFGSVPWSHLESDVVELIPGDYIPSPWKN